MATNYIQPTKVDSISVGALLQAREYKTRQWKIIKQLRGAIEREPLGGNRSGLRLQLLTANSEHGSAMQWERDALRAIEARANELGLTTIRTKATTTN